MQRMFNIRFHAGSRRERAPFVGDGLTVMNDARPAISNATTALFPSGVNPVGNSAMEYRTRKDSEDVRPANEASPAWFLLSDLLSSPADLPSRSCYTCLGRLGETITPTNSQRAWWDYIRRNLYSYARYSRTTLAENPETSELRFLLKRRLSFLSSRK